MNFRRIKKIQIQKIQKILKRKMLENHMLILELKLNNSNQIKNKNKIAFNNEEVMVFNLNIVLHQIYLKCQL